ncbi:Adenylate cyclase 1 [Aquicella siphonis]|uniref:Adenylate cyclase 1 n=1 Tax=Aquicella siphonis TaxID=254247 RepID=A0A5E4PLV3_9COXI|nr:adenylate/guanylate cyclase domain-containing protein [Aquicella siphonis]VVC77232.1 Adenylate cyclase 1 [Aquicella siphonis]
MIDKLLSKSRHWLFSLRFCILAIFISLFLLTAILIIAVTSIAFSDELAFTSLSLMRHVSDVVLHELVSGIRPVEVAAKFSSDLIRSGVVEKNETDLVPYTYYLTSMADLVQGAYWGDEKGNFIYSQKTSDGSISSEIYTRKGQTAKHVTIQRDMHGKIINTAVSPNVSFDPRTRPWYVEAKKIKKTTWTDIYQFYEEMPVSPLGITVASPVLDRNGNVTGVFGVDMRLDFLTKFINEVKVTPHGFAFIITTKENLVAYPQLGPFTTYGVHNEDLINVHKQATPLIDKSIDKYKKTGLYEFGIRDHGETYIVTYHEVPDLANHGWLIGVITPTNDFVSFLKRVHLITLLVSFCMLILGIIIVSRLVARVVKPINMLVRETDKIKRFELEGEITVQSRIKEVLYLRNSISSMKQGLKHFQRYVPKMLVRQLIEVGQDVSVGGERKELVVFFSDIENFTTISEAMNPNQLMEQVCEYFEVMTQVILAEKGTIDKYIGDSIMAFWGAPIEEDHPCERAAKAALECQTKIANLNAKWKKQGKPQMHTRMGIHLGEAVVGNVGSSERINYTALGDTINIASRLENINKVYHTHIVVSDAVYEIIKDKFVLRLVDHVVVKGRKKPIYIYELLGDDMGKIPFDILSYRLEFEKGFQAYERQSWEVALSHFQKCMQIYPEDTIASLFIQRCRKHA